MQCLNCNAPMMGFTCTKCGIEYLSPTVDERYPEWYRDSLKAVDVLKRPGMWFANAHPFTKEFKISSITNKPAEGLEFVAYNGVIAIVYQTLLPNACDTKLGKPNIVEVIQRMELSHVTATMLLGQFPGYDEDFEHVRDLTVFTAPTWIDAGLAASCLGHRWFPEKTASQLLYSFMSCDKSQFFHHGIHSVREFLFENIPFVNEDNFHERDDVDCSAAVRANAELLVNNLGSWDPDDRNTYLFASKCCASSVPTDRCEDLELMWKLYGAPQSEAIQMLNNEEGTKREKYISLWKGIRVHLKRNE